MCFTDGELNSDELKLKCGCDVTSDAIREPLDYENGQLRLFYAKSAVFDDESTIFQPAICVYIRILKEFFPSQYQAMGEQFLD